MLYFVRYKSLNRDLENAIGCRTLPVDQLKAISENLKAEYKSKKRIAMIIISLFTLILAVVCAICVIPVINNIQNSNDISGIIFLIGSIVVIALIFGDLVYKIIVGKVKNQFNRAVKNGYPELFKEIKL